MPAFQVSRWLFLRFLAVVYLLAFVSLASQVTGLIGPDGILPAGLFLHRFETFYGTEAYRLLPTLLWLSASETTLLTLSWGGAGLSLLALVGVVPSLLFPLLWVFYLSLTIGGQSFLSFQWDVLLLETGLLACLYTPLGWRPHLSSSPPASRLVRWLIGFLAFKVTFLSGVTKLVSGDPTWRGLTALMFHYETQPIPAWTSWYAHHLPDWIQMSSVVGVFAIELIVPFAALAPASYRRVRLAAALLMCLLQVGIGATGNYGFFGVLTIVLYLTLLDDRHLATILPSRLIVRAATGATSEKEPLIWRHAVTAIGCTIFFFSALSVWDEATYTRDRTEWSARLNRYVEPFRSINGYGLFRIMTTERHEIVIEGSPDGKTWSELAFRWKPGTLDRRPNFIQPHMPRLDWLLWFAALDPPAHRDWLSALVEHLLDGTPVVWDLLEDAPSLDGPPRFARLVLYKYHFTTPDEGAETGNWWRREFQTYLTDPLFRRLE